MSWEAQISRVNLVDYATVTKRGLFGLFSKTERYRRAGVEWYLVLNNGRHRQAPASMSNWLTGRLNEHELDSRGAA